MYQAFLDGSLNLQKHTVEECLSLTQHLLTSLEGITQGSPKQYFEDIYQDVLQSKVGENLSMALIDEAHIMFNTLLEKVQKLSSRVFEETVVWYRYTGLPCLDIRHDVKTGSSPGIEILGHVRIFQLGVGHHVVSVQYDAHTRPELGCSGKKEDQEDDELWSHFGTIDEDLMVVNDPGEFLPPAYMVLVHDLAKGVLDAYFRKCDSLDEAVACYTAAYSSSQVTRSWKLCLSGRESASKANVGLRQEMVPGGRDRATAAVMLENIYVIDKPNSSRTNVGLKQEMVPDGRDRVLERGWGRPRTPAIGLPTPFSRSGWQGPTGKQLHMIVSTLSHLYEGA
ncbi:hypothetical protein K435DRAFT_811217 [Dendrothele bispora CBS 962.96]|uniref:Uncharacterized protein n=1 Tax=Dendrothele bispora (strain CBS 962.96) TaxID=1314807 RepID=A0A4S8KST3_DENBC|nr:hypothetical protein K435DRAFT_811217 [Dendrothele bispora CBS 962.96]